MNPVALRLRPAGSSFFELFVQSAQHLVGGAELLAEMLADTGDRGSVAERMRDAEHAADETTHAIVRKVNSSFVTPFDREDIYALASGLDDVMDLMDEAVDLIDLFAVGTLPAEFSELVEVIRRCAELTALAMPKLQALNALDDYWIEINRLENSGGRSYRRTLARLLSGEFKAIEALKLKDIAAALDGAIDAFERVAIVVEKIAVKAS